MESTELKYAVESLVNSTWKEFGNYNLSFLNPEYIGLRDSNARPPFYVIALLRFVILKNSICIVSFLLAL